MQYVSRSEDYISTAELAELIGVSAQTLLRASKRQGCPVLRVGRLLKWPRDQALNWFRSEQAKTVEVAS